MSGLPRSELPRFTNITARDILQAAEGSDFGNADSVQLICQGVLSIAAGFRTGHTVACIMVDLKLIGKKSHKLTKMGKLFLYDICRDADFKANLRRLRR